MNIFLRKEKSTPGAYYFGDYDDNPLAPMSVSVATFDESFSGEKKHYHKTNQKVYITLSGKAVLEVNGEEVQLVPEQMVHVEPEEVHRLLRVEEAPFQFVVVNSSKMDDKVVL